MRRLRDYILVAITGDRGKSFPGVQCGCGFRETRRLDQRTFLYLLLRKLESEGPKIFTE